MSTMKPEMCTTSCLIITSAVNMETEVALMLGLAYWIPAYQPELSNTGMGCLVTDMTHN